LKGCSAINGIYFINDIISLNGLSKEESFVLQKQSLQQYIQDKKIQIGRLNHYQLNDYYTIPHALLYDLKKDKYQLDCLVLYSLKVIEDFIYTYPARWLILKSFFKEIIIVEEQNEQSFKKIV
jgi:hypothetical protein